MLSIMGWRSGRSRAGSSTGSVLSLTSFLFLSFFVFASLFVWLLFIVLLICVLLNVCYYGYGNIEFAVDFS